MLFGHELCGVLAPIPGIKSSHLVLEGEVLRTGPPGMSPGVTGFIHLFLSLCVASRAHGLSSCGS